MAQNKFYRILSVAVMATVLTALLAVTAFAEITGGFGEILGLEDGKTYTAKSVTINTTGDGIAYVDADEDGNADVINLATENKDLAGLYEVTEGDNSVLVYVYGDLAERAKLGNWTTDSTGDVKPVFEAPATTFKPGTWMSAKGSVWSNDNGWAQPAATATSYLLGSTWIQSADLGFELFALTNSYETAKTKLTAANLEHVTKWYNTYYNWDDVVVDVATGEPIEGKPAEGVETTTVRTYGDIKDTGIARANAIRETTKTNYESFSYKYAYEPGEIVPVDELKEFPYYVKTVQWYTFPAKAQAQAIFYVVDKNGEVSEYTWTSDYMSITNSSGVILDTVIDVQSILPDEGWVVGVEIKPFGVSDASSVKAVTTGSTNSTIHASQYQYLFHWDKYMTLFGAPEEVTLEGRKFIGLQADEKYVFAPVNVNGIVRDENLAVSVTGVTEFAVPADAYGLWGLFYDREGNFELGCIPVYTYGKYNDRKALGSLGEGTTPLYKNDSTSAWFPGYFNRVGGWAVESFRINDIFTMPYSAGKLNEALATEDTSDEEVIRRAVRDRMRKVSVGYAYTTDEIVPIGDVKTMKFGAWSQNIYIGANNAKPMIELYIIDTEGFLQVVKTVIDETWSFVPINQNNTNCIRTLDVQSIEDLPEGWLVAYKYYPIYDVALEDIVPNTTASQTSTSFGTYMRTPSAYAAHSSFYVIDKPAYATPKVTIDGKVIKGLDASKTYAVVPYNANGMDAGTDNINIKTVKGVTEVDLTTLYTDTDVVGLYKIYLPEDDYYTASAPAIVYVKGLYTERATLGELNASNNFTVASKISNTPGVFEHSGSIYSQFTGYHSAADKYYGLIANTHLDVTTLENYYNALKTLEASPEDATAIKDVNDKFDAIKTTLKGFYYSYLLNNKEIVPISEVEKYTFSLVMDSTQIDYENNVVRYVALVIGEDGNKEKYIYDITVPSIKSTGKLVVDFTAETGWKNADEEACVIPDDGYFAGFEVYPYYGVNERTKFIMPTSKPSTYARFIYRFHYGEDDYVIYQPKAEAPDVELEGTVVTGLQDGVTYKVAPFSINGADTAEESVKTITADNNDLATLYAGETVVGLYAIYVPGTAETAASDYALVFIQGSYEENKTIGTPYNEAEGKNYMKYQRNPDDTGDPAWVPGVLRSGITKDTGWWYYAYTSTTNKYMLNATNEYIYDYVNGWGAGKTTAVYDAQENDDPKVLEDLQASMEKVLEKIDIRYAYTPEEIIPVSEFVSMKFGVVRQNSNHFDVNAKAKFALEVADENGVITEYFWTSDTRTIDSTEDVYTIDVSGFAVLPEEGYVVGFRFYPWGDVDAASIKASTRVPVGSYALHLAITPEDYLLLEDVIKPVVEKNEYIPTWDKENKTRYTNDFYIKNYSDSVSYKYSYGTEEAAGTEWFDVTGEYIVAREHSKFVWVKAILEDGREGQPQRSDKPANPIAIEGISLVLDGTIGVKVNFNYDASVVTAASLFGNSQPDSLIADNTFYPSKFADGKGAIVVPFYPRLVNDLSYSNEFFYNIGGTAYNMAGIGAVSVKRYIDTMKANADGYAEWIPLINALEVYCNYAENYFDTEAAALADLALTADEKLLVEGTSPSKDGSLPGLQFHSSSLVLLDKMTLRHYFKVTDETAFKNAQFSVVFKDAKVEEGSTSKYVYFDIENISADQIDDKQTVTITAGESTFTVSFSAIDYVKLSQKDANAKLRNLAIAVAKYAYAANNAPKSN